MKKPIPQEVKERFIRLDRYEILRYWLQELSLINIQYKNLFSSKKLKELKEKHKVLLESLFHQV